MSNGTGTDRAAAAIMLEVVWDGLQEHVCVLSGRRAAGNDLAEVQHLWLRPADCDKALAELERQARADREAFLSACDFSKEQRRREHATHAHALWADLDQPPRMDHRLPPPTLRVQTSTPDRQLWLWRLAAPVAARDAERLARRIAQVLGADPQACDAARCLRPPGSLNTKHQPAIAARLVEHAPDRVYTLAAIEAALPPDPTQAQHDGTERTNGHVDWAALFVGIPAGERNDRLFRAACRLRGENVPLELARHLALDWAARCQPPLAPAEATRIVEGVYRRYQPTPALPVDGAGAQRARYHGIDRPWPEPPADAVYHGLAGQFVEAVLPHTEADPLALLSQFLVAFGCAVGPQPHAVVGATRHPARLFLGLVGETAKARKGDALQPVRAVFSLLAEDLAPRWANGLASGEGLIWAVRDPIERTEPIKERGRTVGYETVVADAGEPDKRLLVVEPELARVLAVMGRQGNTLSPVLRDAWDSGDLRILTKNAPAKATGAHVAVVGHITRAELERELPDVEMANGFANRFLWLAVRRSKLLPEPEPFAGEAVHALARALAQALGSARRLARIERDAAARALWADIYPELAADRTGLAGALLARAEAQVLRLSLLYALLDGSPLITVAHLHAALELWGYAERSVAFLFGDATGDPIADAIARALAEHGELTRTTISNLFGRHVPAARVDLALQTLLRHGRVRVEQRATDGRPAEVWRTAGEAP